MSIEEIKSTPNQDIIAMLERLLESARVGDINYLAVVGTWWNGQTFDCFQGHGDPIKIIGGLEILQKDIIDIENLSRIDRLERS